MVKQEFAKLIAAIESGALTPAQMEDVVYAIHAAYVDHHEAICNQLPTSLEDVADTMVVARNNVEPFHWEAPKCGYVNSVANVDGVSLEVTL